VRFPFRLALMVAPATMPAFAYDVNDDLAIGLTLAAAGQCQQVDARLPGEDYGQPIEGSDPLAFDATLEDVDDSCRGGMPVQLELDYRPTARDRFVLRLGAAVDNGLNPVTPFRLAPWAADLEDDVEDINGRGRDYLLTAWYRHEFPLADDNSIAASFGILDSTEYLDGNAYANDEFTQFMNEAFVNAGTYNLPSYDVGVAIEGSFGRFSLNAAALDIGENDAGRNYSFWGVQAGWHPELALGAGNYRLVLAGTSGAFDAQPSYAEPTPGTDEDVVLVDGRPAVEVPGADDEALLCWGLSFDQALGDTFGVFLRMAWQDTSAAVDYEALYSGGLNIQGSAWRRPDDNIGIGYGYLEGGNTDVRHTNVFEAYYRAPLNEYFAITADVQYMSDALEQRDPDQRDPEGWIFGLRATAGF